MTQSFDFNKALAELQSGKGLTGKDGVLTPLIKQLTEAALKAELEQHLESDPEPNRKNGTSKKTVKSSVGQFELDTPRDRMGSFEPQLVKKNQTKLTPEIDQKILSMFALGMSYRDIRGHVQEMYGIEISEATITGVTDQLIPELKAWQSRSLDTLYPFIWLDAIHYKIKESGRYVSKAVYTVLGINIEGRKELLGLYVSESEGANYWLSVLTDLHNRGVSDILIACVDGLKGFPEAVIPPKINSPQK
jgi:transposase-like protein